MEGGRKRDEGESKESDECIEGNGTRARWKHWSVWLGRTLAIRDVDAPPESLVQLHTRRLVKSCSIAMWTPSYSSESDGGRVEGLTMARACPKHHFDSRYDFDYLWKAVMALSI